MTGDRWRDAINHKNKGFSLIELLIVVAIILIIAAIAIPNLLRSRISANEASAVGSVRTINTAQVSYSLTYPDQGYASVLSILGGTGAPTQTNAGLLDAVLSNGSKSGYQFKLSAATGTSGSTFLTYTQQAWPVNANQTGIRSFYSDQTGIIRYNSTGNTSPASTDKPLQ